MARWSLGRKGRGKGSKGEAMDMKLMNLGRFLHGAAAPTVFVGPSQVRAYWEGLRNGADVPDRTQLDPRGLGGVLDRVFLAERIGKGLVQVRIAGSALTEAAGMDLRGLPLSCLFANGARAELATALEPVADGHCIAELDLAANRGGPGVVARLVLLPLTDGPDRGLVLGCLGHAKGVLGPGLKFSILRRQEERLRPIARPKVPEQPAPKVPHLRLVHARG
jgi:hypothetical protein